MKATLYNYQKVSRKINKLWPRVKRELLAGRECDETRRVYGNLMDTKRSMAARLAKKRD